MKTITFDRERVANFALSLTGGRLHSGEYEAIGVEENGKIVGGFVYDGVVSETRCFMHCAGIGKNWLTKKLLLAAFAYPFNQLKVNVILGLISSKNVECIKFAKHIGFTLMTEIKDGSKDGDLLIFGLHKDNCKWGV